MRGQQLRARRERLREVGLMDASRRCKFCKRDLHETSQIWEDFLLAGKFCSEECLEAARHGKPR